MTKASSARSVAAVVYDQDTHCEADIAFLAAVSKADQEWIDSLNAAKLTWGATSEAFQTVKRLSTRSRDAAVAKALADLEAGDFEDADLLQAAE